MQPRHRTGGPSMAYAAGVRAASRGKSERSPMIPDSAVQIADGFLIIIGVLSTDMVMASSFQQSYAKRTNRTGCV
jgi:hypothetical protein